MAGQIQGSINNIIGMAAAAKMLDPRAKEKEELRNLGKQEQVLDQRNQVQLARIRETLQSTEEDNPLRQEQLENLREEGLQADQEREKILRRKYELDPSLETYDAWENQKIGNQLLQDEYANVAKQKEAMARQDRQKQAKQTQKRNFMAYLSQQPTSLGGTIGDLSPDLQKKIASQYDRNARRRMMNQMDREARDGKQ